MIQRDHSAILSTFITLPFVIKTFVLAIFEWPFTHVLLYSCLHKIAKDFFREFAYFRGLRNLSYKDENIPSLPLEKTFLIIARFADYHASC